MKVGKGVLPVGGSGRAIANGRDEGFTKLMFDDETHRMLGGGIVGTNAGELIGEVALAIEMGADAVDIGKTIHPHPTLGESMGMAAEALRRRVHRPAAAAEEIVPALGRHGDEPRNFECPAQGAGHCGDDIQVGRHRGLRRAAARRPDQPPR